MIARIGFRGAHLPYVVGLITMALGSIATAAQPLIVGRAADSFLSSDPDLATWMIMLAALFLLDAAGSTLSRLALGWSSERFVFNVRAALAGRITQARIDDVRRYDRGDVNNRMVEDIPLFQRPYFTIFPELYSSILVTFLCLVGMSITSWQLTLALAAVLLMFGALLIVVLKHIQRSAESSRVAEAAYSSFLYEILYNLLPIRALRAQQHFVAKLDSRAEVARRVGVRLVSFSSLLPPIVSIGTQVGIVGVLVLGGVLTANGSLTPAGLAAFFLYLVYIITPLVTIATSLGELKESRVSKDRLTRLYNDLRPADAARDVAIRTGESSTIRVSGVRYAYPNGDAIRFPDLSIAGNGVHCLVGPNGTGKSTLLALIAGLIEPQAGRIMIELGGTSLHPSRDWPYYLAQDRDVLSMTVRENILMGLDFNDEDILATASQLGARAIIDELPDGLDTRLGADGVGLSGGQKQILYAINLLLARPKIALLDEIASNLDARMKESVLDSIAELGQERLIVFVTHDADVLRRFTNVVRLEGEVVEA